MFGKSEMKNEKLIIWLGLVLLAIIFRFITFFPLTIDMDESTYLVIADHFLNGEVLYKDVTDIKPPGIFIIFSLIQLIVGKSIFMFRLVGAIVVGTGAFIVFKTKRNWGSPLWPSIISGMVYVFMFNFYFGFSVSTEIFFVFFTALGIWAYSKTNQGTFYYFLSGLMLGLGFLVKLHVAFDALALGLFILFLGFGKKAFKSTLIECALLTGGFLLPFAITHGIFWMTGYYEYYHFITYKAPFNYSVDRDVGVLLKYFKDGMVTYLPFIILAVFGFFEMKKQSLKVYWLLILMFILEWGAILATGKPHPHYWLQLSLPLALMAGSMFEREQTVVFFQKRLVKIICIVIAAGYLTFLFNYYNKRYLQRSYHSVKIYNHLKSMVTNEHVIYTGDGPQILYWLMNKKSPTPHIHQNHLTYPEKIATYEIDVEKEMDRIFKSDPQYVILTGNYPHEFVLDRMERDYTLIQSIDGYNIYLKR